MHRNEKRLLAKLCIRIRIEVLAACTAASLIFAVSSGIADDANKPPGTSDKAPPAAERAKNRGPQIDEAIERLRELGAFVREFHPRGNPQYWVQIISTGLGPGTRREAFNFDDDALDDVETIARGVTVHLHLRETSVTGAGLRRLASAGNIQILELTGESVDNELLTILPKLPLQGSLWVKSENLTDDGLEPLSRCRELVFVSVTGGRLSNECLEHVVGLPKLEGISLGRNFTPEAFEILARVGNLRDLDVAWQATPQLGDYAKFPKLRRLSLTGKDQGDETALTIAETFKELEQAYLRQTSITTAGVEHLSRMKTLKTLTLDGAPIDEDVADPIRRMKQLQWLSLEGCPIGDATLAAISDCPDLWYLSLSRTHVTDEGLADLVKLKKLSVLYLSSCKSVTDEGLKSLKQLPDSENLHLNIQDSGITEEGARELQKALPHVNVIWGVPPVPLK